MNQPPDTTPDSRDSADSSGVSVRCKAIVDAAYALENAGLFRPGAPGVLADEDAMAGMALAEKAGRLIDAVRVQLAGEIANRCRPELGSEGLSVRMNSVSSAALIGAIT